MLFRSKKIKLLSLILALAIFVYTGPRQILETYFGSHRQVGANRLGQSSDSQDQGRFDALLLDLLQLVQQGLLDLEADPDGGFDKIDQVTELKGSLEDENDEVLAYFNQLSSFIAGEELPAEIGARQSSSEESYQADYSTLMSLLEEIENFQDTSRSQLSWEHLLTETEAFLAEKTPAPQASSFDPDNLPHRSLRAEEPIPPKLTTAEWQAAYAKQVATEEKRRLAKLSEDLQDDPPTPEDLAETIEVQFTDDITQLAADLNHNPVEIYNWVHNNIDFVPIWGSIQGAQLCLETRICNAFDTSSLFIALLRVSGIPARYQVGAIEVPVDEAMNWFGGFSDPAAAARFAASGGVPSAGTVEQGGQIRSLRMEHIWVKAFVDYIPSHAAVHIGGDTWIDIDPSYKLHEYQIGENLITEIGFDVTSYITQVHSTAVIDEQNSAIVSLDHTYIENTINGLVNDISNLVPNGDFQNFISATPIITEQLEVIPASLPFSVLAYGINTATLPDGLRHSVTFEVEDTQGVLLLQFLAFLPEIATKQLSLVYRFASEADIAIAQAAMPPLDPNDPNIQEALAAIPANLVNVRPVLLLNGAETVSGQSVGMGTDQLIRIHFQAPTIDTETLFLSAVAWGRYTPTLDLGGISDTMLNNRVATALTKTGIYTSSEGTEVSLTEVMSYGRDLLGSSWFFAVDSRSELLSEAFQVAFMRYPSIALAYPHTEIRSLFGTPTSLFIDSMIFDAIRQFHVVSAYDGDSNKEIDFSSAIGLHSSLLEGQVIGSLSGLSSPTPGISAASALLVASQQGIPVHAIDRENVESVLPILDADWPRESIRDAVNASLVVFVPQSPPIIEGERILGYVKLDPSSGDGAYLVGTTNGTKTKKLVCKKELTAEERASCNYWLMYADEAERFFTYLALSAVIVLTVALLAKAIAALTGLVTLAQGMGLIAKGVAATSTVLGIVAVGAKYDKCLSEGPPQGVDACFDILWDWVISLINSSGFFDIQKV